MRVARYPSGETGDYSAIWSANGASIYQSSLKGWVYAYLHIPRSEGPAHCLTRNCYGLSARFLVVIPSSWAFSPGWYVSRRWRSRDGCNRRPPCSTVSNGTGIADESSNYPGRFGVLRFLDFTAIIKAGRRPCSNTWGPIVQVLMYPPVARAGKQGGRTHGRFTKHFAALDAEEERAGTRGGCSRAVHRAGFRAGSRRECRPQRAGRHGRNRHRRPGPP